MSDKLYPVPIEKLLQWILAEEKTGRIFGIPVSLFFVPDPGDPFRMTRYGKLLETPIGVAAGPHTQMAQNIICAYLTGTRYIELKTVQTLDELEVAKPCIDMTDEGHNCEWSQELTLAQSFDEYLNAWILLHVLRDKLGWGSGGDPGFIFNMSAGYNLDGIMQPNVQQFLNRMENSAEEKSARIASLVRSYPRIRDLDIPDRISDNLTVSTMHGCPPDEIEKIGRYFIEDRRLHTTIKLNPTLLGPTRLREILNQRLGFTVEVPDAAFGHDLKWDDAIGLIRSLRKSAGKSGVDFHIKLTNTLEIRNPGRGLPDAESMVYMSGRALHPISIHLALCLQEAFDGRLDISFSAGVDAFNISQVMAANLRPLTVCSDILKPGGYGRLSQYMEQLREAFNAAGADCPEQFILARSGQQAQTVQEAGLKNLRTYAAMVVDNPAYHKRTFPYDNIKTGRKLHAFDCIAAPCVETCPANQAIPRYMHHTAQDEYERACRAILETNPLPNIQGMVCDQWCRFKCTRMNYDAPLLIREIKRFVARRCPGLNGLRPAPPNGRSVTVIGAGPSGLACAYFLAMAGFRVDIYEAKTHAGGMAAHGIPRFRLDDHSIETDINAIVSLGVNLHFGERIDGSRFRELRRRHDYLYIGVGAQEGLMPGIPGEEAAGVMDQLSFLSAVRRGEPPALGKKVVVVGGGNAAMDAARTARRLVEPDGQVTILYRRTRKEMPADPDEIQAALDEGIRLVELTAPECLLVEDGHVTANVCFKMDLGAPDESGRPRPIKIEGSEFTLEADTVICAIGQRTVLDFFPEDHITIDPKTGETQIPGVFAGGDAVRGPASLILAIADGKRAAENIRRKAFPGVESITPVSGRLIEINDLQHRQARRRYGPKLSEKPLDARRDFGLVIDTLDETAAKSEAERCLQCDLWCGICATVCPNRANVVYFMAPMDVPVYRIYKEGDALRVETHETWSITQSPQIFNIGDLCNQCGNCATFCPTAGSPFQDKPRFFLSEALYAAEADGYFLKDHTLRAKIGGEEEILFPDNGMWIYETEQIRVEMNPRSLQVLKAVLQTDMGLPISLKHAAQMGVLLGALGDLYLFTQLPGFTGRLPKP